MSATAFADLALPLAARGARVFPCDANKRPLTAHGLNDATLDIDQINAWGIQHPNALVGMPTGEKVFVFDVDVDPAKGIDGFATLQGKQWAVPPTRTHRTRRGGAHYYFRVPDGIEVRNSAGKLGSGLDVRGVGGYVIRWDVHGGEVENKDTVLDAPTWLLEALSASAKKPSAPTHQVVSGVAEGGRNATLASLAGVMRARGLSAESIEAALLVENAAKCTPPLDDDEVRAIARSIGRYEPAASLDDAQAIARLAALPLLDYDRARKEEAKRLGVQVSTLDAMVAQAKGSEVQESDGVFDDVEPWPSAVDGAALLDELIVAIMRFVVCDPQTAVAVALWCATTWLVDDVQVCPILLINAPEKACGKTQLLTVVGKLVPRAAQAAGISPSVLFRMIEKYQPTLLVDEIETVLTREAEDLRGLFNAGHTRDSAFVWRSVAVKDDFEPRRFSVFGFKAIAGINADRLAETVTSRAVVAQLRRKMPHETAQRLRHAGPELFVTLRRKMARWADDHASAIRIARPDLPDKLSDRDQDNWEPLLAVADLAGEKWGRWARSAALWLCSKAGESSQSMGVELLADIKAIFEDKQITRVSMHELLYALVADDEGPWATWSKSKPMTPRALGRLLNGYDIKSGTVKIANGTSPKGYKLEQFQDAFDRYLSSSSGTPVSTVT